MKPENNEDVWIYDASFGGDVDAFKTAMQGILLFYELATPLDEQIAPRTLPMQGGDNLLYKIDNTLSHDACVKYLGYNVNGGRI